MEINKTLGNQILVKLDGKNEKVGSLYIDTTYEPEKHIMRIGTVEAVPEQLIFYKKNQPTPDKEKVYNKKYLRNFWQNNFPEPYTGMEWDTDMEIKVGDKVVMYYLAVQNAFDKTVKNYMREYTGSKVDEWVFVPYQEIYALLRDDELIPINGYVLVEPIEDPEEKRVEKEVEKRSKIVVISEKKQSKKNVVYGKIVYAGKPNREYLREDLVDDHVDVKPGDVVALRKISDIPIEYDMHAKFAGGKKLYRVQRHEILAVLDNEWDVEKLAIGHADEFSMNGRKFHFFEDDEAAHIKQTHMSEKWQLNKKQL